MLDLVGTQIVGFLTHRLIFHIRSAKIRRKGAQWRSGTASDSESSPVVTVEPSPGTWKYQ